MIIRMWFKNYHTFEHGTALDGEEMIIRLTKFWWHLWIDKYWPKTPNNLSRLSKYRRRIAVKSISFLNWSFIRELCWIIDLPKLPYCISQLLIERK